MNSALTNYINSIRDKKITVIGMGVSNIPLIRMLLNEGISVTVRDKSDEQKLGKTAEEFKKLGAQFVLGENYLKDLSGDIIFRTPGLRPDVQEICEAVNNGSVLTSEMEVFFDVCPAHIIAVTGSDGKTTTTTIISELLKASGYKVYVGGNIGNPLLDKAGEMESTDYVVLELSSFQLMTMKKSPEIAVVTNVSPNHLDVHKSMDEYIEAKRNLIRFQNSSNRVVLNYDNEITRSFAETAAAKVVFFSSVSDLAQVHKENSKIISSLSGSKNEVIKTEQILIPGDHNIENYMAAYAAVNGIVDDTVFVKIAETFGGVEHRIELVRELNGVKYYNDSIASSPTRTIAGLRSFKQKVILIAGGKDKGVPFDILGDEIVNHVKYLVLTGLTADKIKTAVLNSKLYNGSPEIFVIDGFKDAVLKASELAETGDIVTLSPACTSFDRFKNFAERGNIYKEIVNSL